MRKSLFADMVKFFEEACEKLSLYSDLFSFYLVLLFLLPLLNCIPNRTEANLGVPQNLRWSSLWKKLMASSFQLVVLDPLQLSYSFFPTLIFSKSSGILVYLTECSYNEIHDTWVCNLLRICRTSFLKNTTGGLLLLLQVFRPGARNIIIVKSKACVPVKNHKLKISNSLHNFI